ncbi:hypothetical protein [Kineosporia succinea]|uniref:Uncharacterized protein n=1 Tax=Kineosporia succinea TaxID=84632 RepID=A0ABT9PAZ4_9ACTN|nr:hypothetical protein [Kineosporia succinea]MDP9829854.1 hypothetical protein [Kineosporia succinea]
MSSGAVLVAALIVVGLVATWWDVIQVLTSRRRRRMPPSLPPTHPARRPALTLEGALARQVMTRRITCDQYRRAMTTVAGRDAGRHPLDLPPDLRPPQVL